MDLQLDTLLGDQDGCLLVQRISDQLDSFKLIQLVKMRMQRKCSHSTIRLIGEILTHVVAANQDNKRIHEAIIKLTIFFPDLINALCIDIKFNCLFLDRALSSWCGLRLQSPMMSLSSFKWHLALLLSQNHSSSKDSLLRFIQETIDLECISEDLAILSFIFKSLDINLLNPLFDVLVLELIFRVKHKDPYYDCSHLIQIIVDRFNYFNDPQKPKSNDLERFDLLACLIMNRKIFNLKEISLGLQISDCFAVKFVAIFSLTLIDLENVDLSYLKPLGEIALIDLILENVQFTPLLTQISIIHSFEFDAQNLDAYKNIFEFGDAFALIIHIIDSLVRRRECKILLRIAIELAKKHPSLQALCLGCIKFVLCNFPNRRDIVHGIEALLDYAVLNEECQIEGLSFLHDLLNQFEVRIFILPLLVSYVDTVGTLQLIIKEFLPTLIHVSNPSFDAISAYTMCLYRLSHSIKRQSNLVLALSSIRLSLTSEKLLHLFSPKHIELMINSLLELVNNGLLSPVVAWKEILPIVRSRRESCIEAAVSLIAGMLPVGDLNEEDNLYHPEQTTLDAISYLNSCADKRAWALGLSSYPSDFLASFLQVSRTDLYQSILEEHIGDPDMTGWFLNRFIIKILPSEIRDMPRTIFLGTRSSGEKTASKNLLKSSASYKSSVGSTVEFEELIESRKNISGLIGDGYRSHPILAALKYASSPIEILEVTAIDAIINIPISPFGLHWLQTIFFFTKLETIVSAAVSIGQDKMENFDNRVNEIMRHLERRLSTVQSVSAAVYAVFLYSAVGVCLTGSSVGFGADSGSAGSEKACITAIKSQFGLSSRLLESSEEVFVSFLYSLGCLRKHGIDCDEIIEQYINKGINVKNYTSGMFMIACAASCSHDQNIWAKIWHSPQLNPVNVSNSIIQMSSKFELLWKPSTSKELRMNSMKLFVDTKSADLQNAPGTLSYCLGVCVSSLLSDSKETDSLPDIVSEFMERIIVQLKSPGPVQRKIEACYSIAGFLSNKSNTSPTTLNCMVKKVLWEISATCVDTRLQSWILFLLDMAIGLDMPAPLKAATFENNLFGEDSIFGAAIESLNNIELVPCILKALVDLRKSGLSLPVLDWPAHLRLFMTRISNKKTLDIPKNSKFPTDSQLDIFNLLDLFMLSNCTTQIGSHKHLNRTTIDWCLSQFETGRISDIRCYELLKGSVDLVDPILYERYLMALGQSQNLSFVLEDHSSFDHASQKLLKNIKNLLWTSGDLHVWKLAMNWPIDVENSVKSIVESPIPNADMIIEALQAYDAPGLRQVIIVKISVLKIESFDKIIHSILLECEMRLNLDFKLNGDICESTLTLISQCLEERARGKFYLNGIKSIARIRLSWCPYLERNPSERVRLNTILHSINLDHPCQCLLAPLLDK